MRGKPVEQQPTEPNKWDDKTEAEKLETLRNTIFHMARAAGNQMNTKEVTDSLK